MREMFVRKNDIGVDIEYYVIAKFKDNNRNYVIYTDYVTDEEDMYRLYVDMVNSDSYITLSEAGKKIILDKFRNEIDDFYTRNVEGD